MGAEITAQLNEYAFDCLKAPVQRVTGYDTVMPYYQLEKHYMPCVKRILKAVNTTLEYA